MWPDADRYYVRGHGPCVILFAGCTSRYEQSADRDQELRSDGSLHGGHPETPA